MNEIIPPSLRQYISHKIMNLFDNITNKYDYLQQDFTGISFNFSIIFNFFISISIVTTVILIFYLLGSKIKLKSFIKDEGITDFFIKIALGYLIAASGILVLGTLSILYLKVLYIYYAVLLTISIYPLSTLRERLAIIKTIYKEYLQQFLKYKWVNIVILTFILICFLRLFPPDVGVDALWYHTDYPHMYIKSHSMMNVSPQGKYYPAVTPTLSDMLYVFTTSISMRESSRFMHFAFYILTIFVYLTVFKKRYSFAPFAALLFVTSPIVIQVAPSAYAEFPWIFCWLLAVFLITSKKKYAAFNIVLPAILIGTTLATKLWMLPFYGVFVIYFLVTNIKEHKIKLLKLLFTFTVISFSIPLLWYLRAYLLTGNPLFPTFWTYPNGEFNNPVHFDFDLSSMKSRITSMLNVSPFSLIGFVSLLIYFFRIKKNKLKNNLLIVFAIILTITQIIINYNFHRFVIPFYSIIALFLGFGVMKFINFNKYSKYFFLLISTVLLLYYFINTLLILPYGLGIANQNRYLSRVLSRDNSSFYDYNNQFLKLISETDIVATYGLWGFYFGNFNYIYAEDIFRNNDRSLNALEKHGTSKLLILGKDINWLCKIEKLNDCSKNKYKLLTSYKFSTSSSAQYLYKLNKYVK